jgi:hypothetical protein
MPFESKWLNWGKEAEDSGRVPADSSGTSGTSLEAENPLKSDYYNNNSSSISTPRGQNSNNSMNSCVQRSARSAKTPQDKDRDHILNGHKVHRVVWQTEAAVIFRDEHGRFWRHLRAYGKTWPVIVEGGGDAKDWK